MLISRWKCAAALVLVGFFTTTSLAVVPPSEDEPFTATPPAPLSGDFTVDPGTIIGYDLPSSTLYKYDQSGTVLETLGVIDTVGLGSPVGLANLGGELWISGTSLQVARINLTTGITESSFSVGVAGLEAMGSDGSGNLLLCGYSDDTAYTYDTSGTLLASTPLLAAIGCTGIDSDGTTIYVADYDSGSILTFDLAGNQTGVIASGLPTQSLSALAFDPAGSTVWVATGFGADNIEHYDLGGTLLDSFPAAGSWHNAMTLGPPAGGVPTLNAWGMGLVLLVLVTALTVLTARSRRPARQVG